MDDAYRAIGRYVVEFSEMVRVMRELVSEYVTGGVVDSHLGHMVLGEATAGMIANAFFGVCRLAGGFDADEDKVARTISKGVMSVIQTRNDVAHGDWWVGLFALSREGGGGQILDPRLVRIRPNRVAGPREERDLAVADIDALTEEVRQLTNLVDEFGKLALKLPVFRLKPDGSSDVSTGDFRVHESTES
jgi:hypothetical protein